MIMNFGLFAASVVAAIIAWRSVSDARQARDEAADHERNALDAATRSASAAEVAAQHHERTADTLERQTALLESAALLREEKKISQAVKLIVRCFRRGGRLFYVGAGTSGRLGALDAYECPPTFSVPPEMTQAIVAGGDQAMHGAKEDAEDDVAGGAQALHSRGVSNKDLVLGIAASGRTPFVWGALHAARELGATTMLLCFNPNLVFKRGTRPTLVIAPRIGPEILTGSTRLKAGTATKLLLNIFTTLSMVRLEKVIENLMVDVHPTNSKLRDRAIRILQALTGTAHDIARNALERNDWSIKNALSGLKRSGRAKSPAARRARTRKHTANTKPHEDKQTHPPSAYP